MADAVPLATPLRFSFAWDRDGPVDPGDVTPTSWEQARASLEQVSTYWLATMRKGGHPHLVPVLAVMVDEAIHFCASERSRKARNLATDPRCVIGGSSAVLDLVMEGEALRADDDSLLARVADAYGAKYQWHPRVRHGGLWAGGAPTAGPPPYRVYRLAPTRVFGFPTEHDVVPTRWEFSKQS